MKKIKCELCGEEVDQRVKISTGKMVCLRCNFKLQDVEISNELDLSLPRDIVWVGKIAKMGVNRVLVIPKTQRPFIKRNKRYFIIIREVEA